MVVHRYRALWQLAVGLGVAFADTGLYDLPRTSDGGDASLPLAVFETTTTTEEMTTADHGLRQIAWVRSKGGFVHESFEIRRADPNDPKSRYGVFAKSKIAKHELILEIPRDCLITSEAEAGEEDICDTVFNLAREMHLANESKYEPYISYLNSQAYGQLPTTFTEKSQDLLLQILGYDEELDDYLLPPFDVVDGGPGCFEEYTPESTNIEMLVMQRSWDDLLIPVWDMVSHRNGKWTNAEERYSVGEEDHPVTVQATKDILPGDEIFMSYSHCKDCGARALMYGTERIMRDYGFVEMMPQKFVFDDVIVVGLDYKYNDDGSIFINEHGEEEILLDWYSGRPGEEDVEFFQEQIERLQAIDLSEKPDETPQHEWDLIVNYHSALLYVMGRVVEDADTQDDPKSVNWIERLMYWVTFEGGYIDTRIKFRKRDPDDPKSRWGVFADKAIAAKEDILFIPAHLLIEDPTDEDWVEGEMPCATAFALATEMEHGQLSAYAPFVNFLLQGEDYGYSPIPSMFSNAGKALVRKILGSDGERSLLPPEDVDQWLDDDWVNACEGDASEHLAASIALQRQWDGALVPLVDILNHRRGSLANVFFQRAEENEEEEEAGGVSIIVNRDIAPEEELFISYGDRFPTDLYFRDNGIVETFPQMWSFGFELDQSGNDDDELILAWSSGAPPDEDMLKRWREQVHRLEAIRESDLKERPSDIPESEWNLITDYHNAMTVALSEAVKDGSQDGSCAAQPATEQK